MSTRIPRSARGAIDKQIRSLARPLTTTDDLDLLVNRLSANRFVCLGEASHGTHEYYQWRARISRRLIEEHGFTWIGVEGDWPDCWRINRWVGGQADQGLDARALLAGFARWPTWMWANQDVADFLTWLRRHNLTKPVHERVGFYGLDVYSLWDSLWTIMTWLEANEPAAMAAAMRAWQCFLPYGEDPHRYAWSTRLVPASCEPDVVGLLVEVRRGVQDRLHDDDAFDAVQNAQVAVDAERYYRTMVRGDRESWNVRDHHMADTIDQLAKRHGPLSKGLVWEHNTHIGDARATDMARHGMVNVGQLIRERHAREGVGLVGFAGHRGSVLAASSWGVPEQVFPLPVARADSHEALLHDAIGHPAALVFDDRSGPWLTAWLDHRAVGVVYNPAEESGNYVPTRIGQRYDAVIWVEQTSALRPLHHEPKPQEPEFETEPTGM